jgi:hypothetical protein
MTSKTDAQLIAAYLRGASGRRTNSVLNIFPSSVDEAVTNIAGVVTVKKAQGAVPVSEIGGPTKAFGRSKISIPEFLILSNQAPRG